MFHRVQLDMDGTSRPAGIIFDVGGVLLDFDHMTICRALSERCACTPQEVYEKVFSSGLEALYDSGLPTGEFYKAVIDAIGARGLSLDDFSRIWCDIFSEKKDVTGIVRALKGKAHLYILSNTNELHFEHAKKQFSFLNDSFSRTFLSYELRSRKPDPRIYQAVIASTGFEARDLFYIDDRGDYVDTALGLGIPSHRFTGAKELGSALKDLGF